jgi:hypothetical protein
MRNIVLHDVLRVDLDAADTLVRVVAEGLAFDVSRLLVSLHGASGRVEMLVLARANEWIAVFDDRHALDAAGIVLGERVRAVAADLDDPQGCYSSCESRLSASV